MMLVVAPWMLVAMIGEPVGEDIVVVTVVVVVMTPVLIMMRVPAP